MQRKLILIGLLLVMPLTGCSNMNNTEKGLLGGTIIGAGLGTAVGILTHNPAAGAVIGGMGGAMVCGAVGNDQDARQARDQYQQARAAAVANATRNQMSITDVIQLSQRNTPDDMIIRQIDSTNSVFALTTNDIIDLQNQGVHQGVIAYMQQRRTRVIYMAPPPPPVVYGPPPPVAIGVGVGIPIR